MLLGFVYSALRVNIVKVQRNYTPISAAVQIKAITFSLKLRLLKKMVTQR